MAFTSVGRTADGAGALLYVLSSKGHNGAERRNEIVTPINMCKSVPYLKQMNRYWKCAWSNHKIQLVTIIQSFSNKEFDSENQDDILKANIIGQELVKRFFPNRQALVCTQIDGKSGYVHNHVLISDVSMDDLKGCAKSQYHHYPIMSLSDKIVSEYTTLDCGQKRSEKVSKKEKILAERSEYSFVEDIKKRVRKAILISESEDDFIKNLKLNGISAKNGKSKTHGDYFTYELTDLSQVPEGTKPPKCGFKKRSYKMGEEYCPEAIGRINELFDRTKNCRQSADTSADTECTPEAEQLSMENVNVTKEKVSMPQAVSELEYEHEPSMKKSGSSSAKAEEEKAETEAAIPQRAQTSKENENIPAGVSQISDTENDDEEVSEDNKGERMPKPENRRSDNISAEGKPEWSINIRRFNSEYMGFSEVQQPPKKDNEIEHP